MCPNGLDLVHASDDRLCDMISRGSSGRLVLVEIFEKSRKILQIGIRAYFIELTLENAIVN